MPVLWVGANLVTSDPRRQAEVSVTVGCESICGARSNCSESPNTKGYQGVRRCGGARRAPERPPSASDEE